MMLIQLIIRRTTIFSFLVLILCETLYGSEIPQSRSSKSYKSKDKADKKYYVSPDKGNQFRAYIYCISAGLELATVENEDETAMLNEVLEKDDIKEGWNEGYWLAGSSLGDPETLEYYWISTGQKVIYTNWAKNQPDNAGKKEFCIGVGLVDKKIAWNDYDPEIELKYICQTRRPCC